MTLSLSLADAREPETGENWAEDNEPTGASSHLVLNEAGRLATLDESRVRRSAPLTSSASRIISGFR